MRAVGLTLFAALLLGSLFVLDAGRARSDGASGAVTVSASALPSDLLSVEIVAVEPGEAVQGMKFRVTVEVTNLGTEPLREGELTLLFDASGLSVMGRAMHPLGALPPDHTERRQWVLSADKPGTYAISAEATATAGKDGLAVTAVAPAVLVTVLERDFDVLEVEIVSVEPSGDLLPRGEFRVTAAVTNTGTEQIKDGEITLHVPAGLAVDDDAPDFDLNPGETEQRQWDVEVDADASGGTYVITAEATATLGDDGLAIRGAGTRTVTVAVADLDVRDVLDVRIVPPASLDEFTQGEDFQVTVEVTNSGNEELAGATVTLRVADGLSIAGDETLRFARPLQPGETRRLGWGIEVDEDASAGTYSVSAEAATTRGEDRPTVDGEDTIVVNVLEATPSVVAVRLMGPDLDDDLPVASDFRITAEVTNRSDEPLPLGTVTLYVDASGLTINGAATVPLDALEPGQSGEFSWTVTANEPGLYAIAAEASTALSLDGPTVVVSGPAVTVRVVETGGGTSADEDSARPGGDDEPPARSPEREGTEPGMKPGAAGANQGENGELGANG